MPFPSQISVEWNIRFPEEQIQDGIKLFSYPKLYLTDLEKSDAANIFLSHFLNYNFL